MRIAVLSPYNSPGGIAEYSRDLYTQLAAEHEVFFLANSDAYERTGLDNDHVLRLWETGEHKFERVLSWLRSAQPDVLHIQLHSNTHFSVTGLKHLVSEALKLPNRPKLFLSAHTVTSFGFELLALGDSLKAFTQILVHRQSEVVFLNAKGLTNVTLFPLPFDQAPQRNQAEVKQKLSLEAFTPLIVTHGLIAPHKGFVETVKAFSLLKSEYPSAGLLCVTALSKSPDSLKTHTEMERLVKELGLSEQVTIIPQFLTPDQIYLFLQAADIGILAYSEVGESASGAVRKFISTGIPTVVTYTPIMAEFTEEVYKVSENSPESLAEGVKALLNNTQMAYNLSQKALQTSQANSWKVASQKLLTLY